MISTYWFLTGKSDTVPEFCFNWITVPRITVKTFTTPATNSNTNASAQPTPPPSPPENPPSMSSSTLTVNTPQRSPSSSTSGKRPAAQLVTGPSRNLRL